MHLLDDIFRGELHKLFEFSSFVGAAIESELGAKGIQLTPEQKTRLTEGLRVIQRDALLGKGIRIQIDDRGILSVLEGAEGPISGIDIVSSGEKRFKAILEKLPQLIDTATDNGRDILLKEIHEQRASQLTGERKRQRAFERRLQSCWGPALDLLGVEVLLAEEIGAEYNAYLRGQLKPVPPRFEMLSRSHARSCQVASEVATLLRHGFADGAHARWRTMHEIAVEMAIIRDGDDDLATRYLAHDVVQKLRAARTYQAHCMELAYQPLSDDEVNHLTEEYGRCIQLYGAEFANDNGWASAMLAKPAPRFADLEARANIQHMRPFYRLACLNVHAGPRGISYRLGLDDSQQGTLLLAGPSASGLAEPIQNAAYSLVLATNSLLTFDVNFDYLVAAKVMIALGDEVFQAADEMLREERHA